MANKYLPISVSLQNRPCLVVGGGTVALRKVDTLLDYECDVTVIATEPHDKLEYYAQKNSIKLEKRAYKSPEAAAFGMVISATDDHGLNEQVYNDCIGAGVLVNVVDNPPLCNFVFPAVVKRDALTVAVSTDGKAPFLSGQLRLILENVFPDHWNKIIKLAATFRKKVQQRWPEDAEQRSKCFGLFIEADWKTMIKEMTDEQIDTELDLMLAP